MTPKHGFTSVDQQADPKAWVNVLDKVRAEPFYAAYKKRTVELLQAREGASYLDLGAETGDDARLIKTQAKCIVVAADRSITMASTCPRAWRCLAGRLRRPGPSVRRCLI
jgi:hypothetical protein